MKKFWKDNLFHIVTGSHVRDFAVDEIMNLPMRAEELPAVIRIHPNFDAESSNYLHDLYAPYSTVELVGASYVCDRVNAKSIVAVGKDIPKQEKKTFFSIGDSGMSELTVTGFDDVHLLSDVQVRKVNFDGVRNLMIDGSSRLESLNTRDLSYLQKANIAYSSQLKDTETVQIIPVVDGRDWKVGLTDGKYVVMDDVQGRALTVFAQYQIDLFEKGSKIADLTCEEFQKYHRDMNRSIALQKKFNFLGLKNQ